MEVIELSIKQDYVEWGLNEGVREIFQNSIDADAKGNRMAVDYDANSRTLSWLLMLLFVRLLKLRRTVNQRL